MAQYLDKAGLTTLWTRIKTTFALKSHTHKKSEITDLTIPTVNNPTITINQGGVKKGSFSLNQSGAATIDLTDDNTTYSAATQSANGLMSSYDKKKLDGIADGANKITVDESLSSTSTNPVQNKVIKSALDGKAGSSHSHSSLTNSSGRVFNVPTGGSGGEQKTLVITDDLNAYQPAGNYANASHDHTISDITGLYDELTGMTYVADSSDNNVQLETYGDGNSFNIPTKGYVDNALDGKSDVGHTHTISNITNLQSTIDSIYSDMGLQDEAIAGKSDVGHTHKKSDITDLSIPTVNNPTITINQGGTKKGSFTLNQSGAATIDLTDNNTTYTAGAGLDLSNGAFSVKTGYTTNGKNYKVTTDSSGNLYVSVPWNNDTWRPVVDNLTTTDATKSLSANQGKVLKDLVDGKLTNYNNTVLRPNGTSFTFPNGTNPVQMRSGATSGADLGIFRLSDDNAFICNSSDIGYAFAVFDTDKTSDFSSASNAAFAVLSDHAGVSIKGGLSVDGKAVSLDGHTHSYLPLSGGTLTGTLGFKSNYLVKPVAEFRTQDNTFTGAITIALPAGISNTMVSMWIDVYNYSTNTSFSVHVGGYTYENNTWQHNPFAMVYGANHTVRLGHNGTNFVIYIGETNSTWSYPQISVRDVILGYTPTYDNWKKDWGISFVTSFSNVSATINNYAWTTKNFTPPTSLPANGGNADTLDGNHASAFAKVGAHNDLTSSGNEFTFASSGFSGAIYLNWRTAGGTNGNITDYILGNGAGGQLGTIIHSGNIGSQSVNYANSAGSANSVAWGNVSGRPTSLPASNISMSSDGTTLTITYS